MKSLFEPLSDLAKTGRAILIVDAIVGDAIDKKERKNLDAFAFKGALLLQVLLNRLIDLRASDVVAKAADFLTQFQETSLIEFDIFRTRRAVDICTI